MKFLLIAKPNGNYRGFDAHAVNEYIQNNPEKVAARTAGLGDRVKAALESAPIEKAYALIAGGFVLVVNANDAYELGEIIRTHTFFRYHEIEIMPIADAFDFLSHAAQLLSGKKQKAFS